VAVSATVLWAWLVAAAAVTAAAMAWRELRRGRELVARACHELRGPLTAAHLALHASDGPGARLAAIDLELKRAGLALDDLAAARSGRQAADRAEVVDIGELLTYQAATWEAIAPVFGCDLRVRDVAPDVHVCGDRVRLAQAVGNLVANALEHGAGTVEVSARAVSGRVRIEVSDEGEGLPAPVADLVRRPRGGRGRRGRGLAIATEIVERHGGRIVSAPSAGGARLAIEMPAGARDVVALGGGRVS
jgi:signal transduction histidine kinase